MDDRHYLREGNTQPSLVFTAIPDGIVAVGNSAKFSMWDSRGAPVITGAAATLTISPAAAFQYDWQAGDVAVPGTYFGRFDRYQGATLIDSWPNFGAIEILISPAT